MRTIKAWAWLPLLVLIGIGFGVKGAHYWGVPVLIGIFVSTFIAGFVAGLIARRRRRLYPQLF